MGQKSLTDDSDIIISHKVPSHAKRSVAFAYIFVKYSSKTEKDKLWNGNELPLIFRPAYPELVSMPGVPSYDPLEQQLLASLERELGVL